MLFPAFFFSIQVLAVDDVRSRLFFCCCCRKFFFRCTKTTKTFRFISTNKIFMHSQFLSHVSSLSIRSLFVRRAVRSFVRSPIAIQSIRVVYLFSFAVLFHAFLTLFRAHHFCNTYSHFTVHILFYEYTNERTKQTNANGMFVCPSPMSRQITKFYLLRPFFAFIFMCFPSDRKHKISSQRIE